MKTYKKKCKECGKDFIARNSKAIFCSSACKSKEFKKRNVKEYIHKCLYCEKEFVSNEKKTKFCSFSCSGKHRNMVGTGEFGYCKFCDKKFKKKHARNKFCSTSCKRSYNNLNLPTVKKNCSYCDSEMQTPRKKSNKQDNFFCSRECESRYREEKANDTRICEWCNFEFKCKKHDKLRFCSMVCQSEWQKTKTGKSNPTYKHEITDEMRVKQCEYCGKDIFGTPKSLEKTKYCCYSCKVKATPKTMTLPHRDVIKILNQLGVGCVSEVQCGRYSLDVVILNTDLTIEIMGSFWHCDERIYSECVNEIQEKSIIRDRKKKIEILKRGMIPLYVWEKDISENYEMCLNIIRCFIEDNGKLNNYHSMNYVLENGILKLSNKILVPKFEK